MSTGENLKRRVLLVEPDSSLVEPLALFLGVHGFDVTVEEKLEAAPQRLGETQFDVLLFDPGPDGANGERLVSFLEISLRKPPGKVVAMSARSDEAGVRALLPRITALLAKPFGFEELRVLLG